MSVSMGRGSKGTGSTGRGSSGRKSKSYISVKDFTKSLDMLTDAAKTAATDAVKAVTTAVYVESFDNAESIPFYDGTNGTVVVTGTGDAELSQAVQKTAQSSLQSLASLVECKIGAVLK